MDRETETGEQQQKKGAENAIDIFTTFCRPEQQGKFGQRNMTNICDNRLIVVGCSQLAFILLGLAPTPDRILYIYIPI